MRIGELAHRTGASPRSLRYYEAQELLASRRTPGGHREYDEGCVERVGRIRCLLEAGLSSSKISELLPCMYAQERGDPAPDLVDWLREEREHLSAAIERLTASRDMLDGVIRTARGR